MAGKFQGIDFYDVDSLLSEEERMIRDTVREWVEERVMPLIGKAYIERRFPKEIIPEWSFAAVQSALVMYPIYAFGSDEHKQEWLPKLATGEKIGCFGLSEPDHGSNPAGMITTAKKTDDGWLLNGTKMWITNGSMADVAVIWAQTAEIGDTKGIRGFVVPTDVDGLYARDQKGKLSPVNSAPDGLHNGAS